MKAIPRRLLCWAVRVACPSRLGGAVSEVGNAVHLLPREAAPLGNASATYCIARELV
jgi:hypothetical protein